MERTENYLMLSGIQHFYFCKRQWALIHIEQQWGDNQATMEGHFIHKNADDPFLKEKRKNLLISRGVPVISHTLRIRGILDVLEFKKGKSGDGAICLKHTKGYWLPKVVEYKRGKSKPDHRDMVQLTAQVICVEEMLGCEISHSDIYYKKTNRRLEVEINQSLRSEVKNLIDGMYGLYEEKRTPKAEKKKSCTRCSLYDICLPKLTKKQRSVKNYIYSHVKEECLDA